MCKKFNFTVMIDLPGKNNFQITKGDNNHLSQEDAEIRKNLAILTEENEGKLYLPKGHYFRAKFDKEEHAIKYSSKARDIMGNILKGGDGKIKIEIINGKGLRKYHRMYSEI